MKGCNLDGLELHTWQSMAQELWGERWKSTLALTAKVTKRTVQRWNAGAEPNKEVLQKLEETYNIWILCQQEDHLNSSLQKT